ncbi:MAG: Uma2 family endonuclease [Crocosphaera sp.]
MSPELTEPLSAQTFTETEDWWEQNQPPSDLIFDDGEPLESNRHRVSINLLCDSLLEVYSDRTDFFTGGNMFIYFSREQVKNKDFKGPDFFAVLDVDGSYTRQGWVVWDEGGRYPDVIIELMSPSTAKIDVTTKKDLYERTFKTADYFVYNPFDANSLRGWHLESSGNYEDIVANEKGWLWCQKLNLWVGVWQGEINRDFAPWLRFYDTEENLVLLPKEAERQRADNEQQRADNEQQRAERLAARLRELGEDPDSI